MKTTNKKINKGFTLVEVIVVAVIVAILAAVAIPIYQGYVDDSNKDQASNTAGSVASFCGACAAKGGACAEVAATATAPAQVSCPASTATIGIPTGTSLTLDATAKTVTASRGAQTSEVYYW